MKMVQLLIWLAHSILRISYGLLVVLGTKDRLNDINIDYSCAFHTIHIQLSKLQECTLEYVMDLPFEMRRGSCNVFLSNNVERAWLCFTEDSPSSCQS